MVRLVCIHSRGVCLQSGVEYLGTDSRAEQNRFRVDSFDIVLLTSWAAIALLAASVPLTWLVDSKGWY